MTPLNNETCRAVVERISGYRKKDMISFSAGLLTVPKLSSNAIRCETLVHLAVSHSRGNNTPNRTVFRTVLNDIMGGTQFALDEDPQEDTFVSNILMDSGDLRVFNGLWEANDYYVQALIDIGTKTPVPECLEPVKKSCVSLLKLSEEVARRSGLDRNSSSDSLNQIELSIPNNEALNSFANRVVFSSQDIDDLGVSIDQLSPFFLTEEEAFQIRHSTISNSPLLEKPIINIGDEYIVALPSAIGISIRKIFIKACIENNLIPTFSHLLQGYHAKQLLEEALREYKESYIPISPNIDEIPNLPQMHSILLSDHSGNYIHAVLLHDDIEEIAENGMDSFHSYDKETSDALNKYLVSTADYCKSLDGYRNGTTLITYGGLGRGHSIGLNEWPDGWLFSSVSLNDLLLLSGSKSKPLKELFQCLNQKDWAQHQGLIIQNINGDINYYGFWVDNEYKCV